MELVLRSRAAEKDVALRFVDIAREVPSVRNATQKINAILATEVTAAFIASRYPNHSLTPNDVRAGIEKFS